jgi:nucleoside-diphosphate-sugar epimerase
MTGYATVRLANIYGLGDNFDPATAMVIPSLLYKDAGAEITVMTA